MLFLNSDLLLETAGLVVFVLVQNERTRSSVHWYVSNMQSNRHPQVDYTIWKHVRDVTDCLDRSLMDAQFCQSDKEVKPEPIKGTRCVISQQHLVVRNMGI